MPPLRGFSDNPFRTRDDLKTAAESLVRPLFPYFSLNKARVRIPIATGTHFDETAAQFEGFARPLWVIGSLLMASDEPSWELIQPWLEGFETGTNPANPEYWGPIRDHDQKMVEAEMVSFCLLAPKKERFWDRFSTETQTNIINWLSSIHGKAMPHANWLWFRVFVNLALINTCAIDNEKVRQSLKADLEILDTFYMTDGWSCDGLWRSTELDVEEWETYQKTGRAHTLRASRNACYYSGSFAIQFSQLLYVRFAGDLEPARTARYQQQARDFGDGFWRYFDSEGAAVPFGRSLTYRFACGAFFSALALANISDMPEPLDSPGKIKGFLLRHLRWWASHSDDIFYTDGTMNLGWVYPNMYLTEDYNSPQSVYWCLKSLVVVGLDTQDDFWTEPEVPYPQMKRLEPLRVMPGPRQIICNHSLGNHHFLLSFSQFVGVPFKAAMAKYCKFAYSSAFGFSVPTGPASLSQVAPDSTLAFSRDGGETWAVKFKAGETTFGRAICDGEAVPTGKVTWHPWADRTLEVTTTVIPPTSRWPDWHIRIHQVKANETINRLLTAEGGFAIHGRQRQNHLLLPKMRNHELSAVAEIELTEGVIETETSALVMSEMGASGICFELLESNLIAQSLVSAFKPEPNSNIMASRSLIPLVEHNLLRGLQKGEQLTLITKVFAISSAANG